MQTNFLNKQFADRIETNYSHSHQKTDLPTIVESDYFNLKKKNAFIQKCLRICEEIHLTIM